MHRFGSMSWYRTIYAYHYFLDSSEVQNLKFFPPAQYDCMLEYLIASPAVLQKFGSLKNVYKLNYGRFAV